ncbi:helix-turn-helix transcriptional regulator [Nonomuraea longicatena]|uniref:Helix-turn-helix transcriptional regulator n=1 Tax=Nonomuraea longicatena TaxID=83682 RepID=A0ABP4BDI3_9ACTN
MGLRLREIRRDAGLSGRTLAALAGWHFTRISKIEHGRTVLTKADLELWCFHCQAQSELPDLLASIRSIERMYLELRRLHRSGTARYQRELLEGERQTHRFRSFTTSLIPGVLQTREYATALLVDIAEMMGHPADVEPTVDLRMERGQLLRSGKLFHFVIMQSALAPGVVPADVMRSQLEYLLEAQALPGVRLGILPSRVRHYMALCEFWITDDACVEVETFSAILKIERPGEIAVYAKVFDHYAQQAVYGESSRDVIHEMLRDL